MSDYDLVIVGAGSGNMLPIEGFDGWRVAIVERDRFGGTCLNRGCIPSKMLVHAADVVQAVETAGRYGIHAEFVGADWPAIRDRVFTRLDRVSDAGIAYRRRSGVEVVTGEARFVGPGVLEVDGRQLRSSRFVLAAGARPSIPDIPGLADVPFHTSDTVMRIAARPESMVILGGSSVAVELAHVFGAFGTAVTMVEREPRLLAALDDDLSQRFTELAGGRFDLRLGAHVTHIERTGSGVAVHFGDGSGVVEAEMLLVAVGRTPNSDVLDVARAGIVTDATGRVLTDDTYATNVPGVWAIGDLTNRVQLKHLANAEVRLVFHNLAHPDDVRHANFPVVPAAVFADPQIATAGPTERSLRDNGTDFIVAHGDYSHTACGWAQEDTTSFMKLIADPATRRLLAAHVIGPQAATIIQPLVQAIFLDNTIDQLAHDVLYVHPAVTEVIAQTLLRFPGIER